MNSYSPVSPYQDDDYAGSRGYVPRSSKSKSPALFEYLKSKRSKNLHIGLLITAIIVLVFAVFTTYVYNHDFTIDEINSSQWSKVANYISWVKQNKYFVFLVWVILLLLAVPSCLWFRKYKLNSNE